MVWVRSPQRPVSVPTSSCAQHTGRGGRGRAPGGVGRRVRGGGLDRVLRYGRSAAHVAAGKRGGNAAEHDEHRSHGAGLQRLACWLQGAGPFWLQGARRNIVSGAVRSPDTGTSAGQPVVPGGQSVSGDDAGPWY